MLLTRWRRSRSLRKQIMLFSLTSRSLRRQFERRNLFIARINLHTWMLTRRCNLWRSLSWCEIFTSHFLCRRPFSSLGSTTPHHRTHVLNKYSRQWTHRTALARAFDISFRNNQLAIRNKLCTFVSGWKRVESSWQFCILAGWRRFFRRSRLNEAKIFEMLMY